MKKLVTTLLSGAALGALALSCLAGCESADAKGEAYENPQITIQAGSVADAVDISDLLFGTFLEDINFAGYALDDNLLANGNFEELNQGANTANYQNHWTATQGATVKVGDTEGVLSSHADYHNPTVGTNVSPHYASVTVTAAGGGLSNSGYSYPAIAVVEKTEYTFSAFIKAGANAKATARVCDGSGKEYASVTFDVKQGDWVKYRRTVKASATVTKDLHFELVFDTPATYLVDAVQLETNDSTLGFKNYIYNAVKELTPKFMRFPGGCIIEGDNSTVDEKGRCLEVYDWKNSVGAVQNGNNAGDDTIPAFTYQLDTDGKAEETTTYGEYITRSNNFDLWGYNMDYGLGFYEYFLLCESIGASPVPIVNCGFSDQGGAADASKRGTQMMGRHLKETEDYVQDALNLIEFANGDTNTKWGKIRADMGHPEPFNVKYIGIGNEQFTETYYRHYEQFLEAFFAAQKSAPAVYGGVQPIVGNGLVFADALPGTGAYRAYLADSAAQDYMDAGKVDSWAKYGVVDHHYYMGYNDFLYYASPERCIYDKYDRTGEKAYKVFVGEYSANAATNYAGNSRAFDTNSWMTALSEAAYMTGLERNGDVVDLAAYAPMFGVCDGIYRDDGANQWDVDMMYFTNTELLLSPNYYVQKLFMNNSGTHVLKSTMTLADGVEQTMRLDLLSQDVDRVYQAVTYDENTKDIIVKIVNAGDSRRTVNIDLSGASVKAIADCTILESSNPQQPDGINRLGVLGYHVSPREFTLEVGSVFGYTVTPYSVLCVRIHTK